MFGQDLLNDLDGQELSLNLHGNDGQLSSFEGSSGKFITNKDSNQMPNFLPHYCFLYLWICKFLSSLHICNWELFALLVMCSFMFCCFAGKVYDFISDDTKKVNEYVFVSSSTNEPKIGMKPSIPLSFILYFVLCISYIYKL